MTPFSKLRVMICDDEPAIRKDIQLILRDNPAFEVVACCGSVKDATLLIPALRPDVLLLDIALTDGTAFDILAKVAPYKSHIIFLTAYKEHAIQAIKVGADDYLLKPIDEEELNAALENILQQDSVKPGTLHSTGHIQNQTSLHSRIVLSSQRCLEIIDLSDIIYCQGDAGYTTFFLATNRKVITSKCLKDYEEELPPTQFIRPHQSYLVHFKYVDKYRKDGFLILKNGIEIPVATRRKDVILEYFNQI